METILKWASSGSGNRAGGDVNVGSLRYGRGATPLPQIARNTVTPQRGTMESALAIIPNKNGKLEILLSIVIMWP